MKTVQVLAGAGLAAALLGFGRGERAPEEAAPVEPVPPAAVVRVQDPDSVLLAMRTMLDDERRAAAEYERAVRDHGRVAPFVEFAVAERSHAEFIAYLYRDRQLPVPPGRWTPDNARSYRTPAAACAAAAASTRRTVELYDRYLSMKLPSDVRRVFRHNRNVSDHVHLPAFESCANGSA